MKTRNASIRFVPTVVAFVLASALMAFGPAAHASLADQATQFTFDQDVRIPGQVLPAGTYWFVLLDSPASKNIVRVYNFDRTEFITSFMTNAAQRLEPPDHTRLTLTQPADAAEPATLLTWFYPGQNFGHQFVYSTALQYELAQEDSVTMEVDESGPVWVHVKPAPVEAGDYSNPQ